MSTDFKVAYLLEKIMLDDETSKCIKSSIDNIMRDGKIDQYDIPEILLLITEIMNNSNVVNTKLTAEDLTSLIKELYKFIEKCKKNCVFMKLFLTWNPRHGYLIQGELSMKKPEKPVLETSDMSKYF